jgi:RNA polymerase primary sigma factor
MQRAPERDRPRSAVVDEHVLVLAAQAGDGHARDELIEAFEPLIGSVARHYQRTPGVSRGELMQDGVVGLLRALGRFDPDLGTPFWAYASWWVRQAMQELVSELGRPVVLSDRAVRQLARVRLAQRRHVQEHGHEPTVADLSEATGLPVHQIDHLVVAARLPRGLEEPVAADDTQHATFRDQLADPRAEEAYERVPSRLIMEQLPRLLDGLDDRERTIVDERFGLEGPERTLRDLGARLGVSAERVRQIEGRALDKLRDAVETPLMV